MKLPYALLALLITTGLSAPAYADHYVIDTKNEHAFIQFKISHLGYSWVLGRFDNFKGDFDYDAKHPDASKLAVTIDVSSIDTNLALRDKHLRSDEFFDVAHYPTARFVSTAFTDEGHGKALLKGRLTLHGVTRQVSIDVQKIGQGPDPWGGYRCGFQGKTTLRLKDYNIDFNLGPTARTADLFLSIEGIRQK